MVLLLVGVFDRKEQAELILWAAVLVSRASRIFRVAGQRHDHLFGDSFIVDPFARAVKLLTLTGRAVTLIMSIDYWRGKGASNSSSRCSCCSPPPAC
jgi:NADH-quinone oxidoreductase subunit N